MGEGVKFIIFIYIIIYDMWHMHIIIFIRLSIIVILSLFHYCHYGLTWPTTYVRFIVLGRTLMKYYHLKNSVCSYRPTAIWLNLSTKFSFYAWVVVSKIFSIINKKFPEWRNSLFQSLGNLHFVSHRNKMFVINKP